MGNPRQTDWLEKGLARAGPVEPVTNNGLPDEEKSLEHLLRQVERLDPQGLELLERYIAALKARRSREG